MSGAVAIQPADRPIPRNLGIDVLRGLSILLVVMHHTALRIPLKTSALAEFVPRRFLDGLAYNGYEAVFVFFVISGFLIAGHSLRRWTTLSRIDIRTFYAQRFARIVPCLVLLLAILSLCHVAGFSDYVIKRDGQSLGGAIFAVATLQLNVYEGHTGYLPGGWDVLWSLSIEEVFYLAFPLICLVVRRESVLIALLIVLALSLPLSRAALAANEIWQEKAYLPGMAAIATGILAALLMARVKAPRRWVARTIGIVGALGLGSVLFFEGSMWPLLGNGVMLILTGSAACLVIALQWLARDGERPIRSLGWLRSLGRLSYEVYLAHMFVVFAVVALFKAFGGDLRYGFLWYVPAVGFSWLLGAIVAKVYSVPCDRALRRRWVDSTIDPREATLATTEYRSPDASHSPSSDRPG